MKSNSTQTETPTVQKFSAIPTSTPAPFGDKGDVATLLKCCRRSVDGYMAQGLPHLKLGARKVRFDLDEVREWAKREFGTHGYGKEKHVVNPIFFCTDGVRLANLHTVSALSIFAEVRVVRTVAAVSLPFRRGRRGPGRGGPSGREFPSPQPSPSPCLAGKGKRTRDSWRWFQHDLSQRLIVSVLWFLFRYFAAWLASGP